ncbi:MAG: hypothetical protein A2725_04425 [Candidatus Magasanikbacteria bacterium RIFCSPHIGHO2_01_FULL_33_34]|uniref:BioF2-like acetyltransferase domain-containing protein n=1 Tax=Candidatus Magasanikbacteria bacterium RIFCSPHIGHO2_01_FULL_33_34 TaxID=1798671 RepID=A0A1F6LHT2_9BACT|nr:MAG: hypothetical protein A2725_04425 [Candidatus Magasanikbacteria bacterium RIFCSPHIGHO2_01_FULL_33_34]OGH65209.1 MAG: hypothetical protein A3B83_04185 [Candidatus Magasanikbacteria bacterium RIFCSPHIGHO2_02_FULL_33_17]OGH75246.1 MAG: hypothetical protein A3A89_03980 [Candidatus Magasanikbacteria bacterium RIFCSPLOWO2_01_FULL_33_34]OGH82168.1 MAG: hypothetical protein A3F93_00375 [Candidatus Magasanikbacteria bacterium RIFCSPLOWO2_12_FULL_34_7]
MQIAEIKNQNEWEEFNKKQAYTLFVQSLNYGEFYKRLGEKPYIIGIYENDSLVGGALILSVHAKRGNFLYIPYGPILPEKNKAEALKLFTKFIFDFAKSKKEFSFVRVSPFLEENTENRGLFKSLGYKSAPMHILAERTWLLDITPDEETLLSGMNKNHRNLIRRCMRENVKIIKNNDPKKLNTFLSIYTKTAQRHNFFKFSDQYITNEFSSFSEKNEALLFDAYLPDSSLDSSAIIMYYGSMAAYRHGASLNINKKLPTSYLLQWEAICEAKKRGIKYYNFWGIAPENSPKHPFHGITHFKKGFGGYSRELMHCHDLPITNKYYINWFVESIRRIKRGF